MIHANLPRPLFSKGAAKYLLLVFVLLFLAVQSSALVHSHGGELDKHVDCTLCLKIGSGHDVLPSSTIHIVIPTASRRFAPVHETAIIIAQVPARSRSPPPFV